MLSSFSAIGCLAVADETASIMILSEALTYSSEIGRPGDLFGPTEAEKLPLSTLSSISESEDWTPFCALCITVLVPGGE